MTDVVDEYMIKHVRDFDGKKFTDVSSENIKFKDEDEDLQKRREKAYQKKFKPLTKWLKKLFGQTVMRVQVAKRSLGSMPAVVSMSDFGNSANMERIMKAQSFANEQDMMMAGFSSKVFDLNPRHPLTLKLLEAMPEEEDESFEADQTTIDTAWTLHDMAMLSGGYPISDPKAHNKRMMNVLQSTYNLESLALEPEIDPPVEDDEPDEPDFDMGGMNMDDFAGMGDFDMGDMDINLDEM